MEVGISLFRIRHVPGGSSAEPVFDRSPRDEGAEEPEGAPQARNPGSFRTLTGPGATTEDRRIVSPERWQSV